MKQDLPRAQFVRLLGAYDALRESGLPAGKVNALFRQLPVFRELIGRGLLA